jgi:hypothetical protein
MEYEERYEALRRKRHSMSHTLPTVLQVVIALFFLAIVIWPDARTNDCDLDATDSNATHIP